MKVKVLKKFRDKNTGEIYKKDAVITVSEERFAEIQKVDTTLVEVVEEATDKAADEVVEEATDKAADEVVEEATDKAADEVVEETTGKKKTAKKKAE